MRSTPHTGAGQYLRAIHPDCKWTHKPRPVELGRWVGGAKRVFERRPRTRACWGGAKPLPQPPHGRAINPCPSHPCKSIAILSGNAGPLVDIPTVARGTPPGCLERPCPPPPRAAFDHARRITSRTGEAPSPHHLRWRRGWRPGVWPGRPTPLQGQRRRGFFISLLPTHSRQTHPAMGDRQGRCRYAPVRPGCPRPPAGSRPYSH